jgi:hypothetical protein
MAQTNNNQFFSYNYGNDILILETCVNGEGYYSYDNNTILGTIYDMTGKKICVSRIDYSLLKPLAFSTIKRIFPNA